MRPGRTARALAAALMACGFLMSMDVGPASADSTYFPPTGSWHGRKIYISPASHANPGCDSYVESTGARAIATKAKDYLVARGYAVRIGSGVSTANVTSSNAWVSNVHIPIHTNAGTSDCTSPYSYANGGSWLMYKPGSTSGSNLSQKIFDQLKGSSPGTTDLKSTDEVLYGGQLHELRATNMPSAYVEAAFHTFRPDVDWLRITTTVGNKIGAGIDNYFGNPRCPCPTFAGESSSATTDAASIEAASPFEPTDTSTAARSTSLEDAYLRVLAGGEDGSFGPATAGMLNGVWLTDDGVAVVDFKDIRSMVANTTTTFGVRAMLSDLNRAGFAHPQVRQIEYRLDGSCGDFWSWLEAECYRVRR